jgi:hypothetical protein
MAVHEYCVVHDQPLEWCKDQDACKEEMRSMYKFGESVRVRPYLSGWERVIRPDYPGVITFLRGDFMIHIIGKHDIRLIGKGFSGEMRFYDAAKKVMELDG